MPDLTFQQSDIKPHIDRVIAVANRDDVSGTASTGLSSSAHRRLRSWLDALSRDGPCSSTILKSIGRAVGRVNTQGEAVVHIDDEQQLRVVAGFSASFLSPLQECAFWLACLLHDTSTERMGRCALPECDRFFFRPRVGRPKEYCSDGHASLARVRRSRTPPKRR